MCSTTHHLEIRSGHLHTQWLNIRCLLDRIDRLRDQVITINLHLVSRALTDSFPERFKLPRRIDLFVEFACTALPLLLNKILNLTILKNLGHERLEPRRPFRKAQGEVLVFRPKSFGDPAIFVEESVGMKLIPNKRRLHIPQHLTSIRPRVGDLGKLFTPDIANRHTGLDVLLLKTFRELLKRLISYHRQLRDRRISDPLTILVHRQSQSTTNSLPSFCLTAHFPERTNLEDIGIIPPLTESGMGENEADWLIVAKQPSLVLHDQVVGVIIFRSSSRGIAVNTLLNLREVGATQLRRLLGQ